MPDYAGPYEATVPEESTDVGRAIPPDDQTVVCQTLKMTQARWAAVPLPARVRIIRRFTRLLPYAAPSLIRLIADHAPLDVMTAEILPLMAASRFLCREAPSLLKETRLDWLGRPLWLQGVKTSVVRKPLGVVLILAPGNYPLMLAGIQTLQALVAGNSVALKPAPGRTAVLHRFLVLLEQAGLPKGVVQLVGEDSGPQAVSSGYDLIILTGSAETGRKVALAAAETLTPTIMELSGADPVFVLPDADLALVARALHFGQTLKGGHTCIAPRRIFISEAQKRPLQRELHHVFGDGGNNPTPDPSSKLAQFLCSAKAAGGEVVAYGKTQVIFLNAHQAGLADIDLFAPWFAVITTHSVEEAICLEDAATHALGASIFGHEREALAIARRIPAGTITINDVIVPSADPRLPFGGAHRSGFGVTRGREGLLALTRPVSISTRKRGAFHLLPWLRQWHGR
ncbi:acyl-CoA reductase-like NAD-dependent aldehyde dehydrogenase [Asaia bogorensis NBRC 16594]|nr:acyl-CoA reductase-like NAD-dependent aldehyde dehydrogenase [Asaia bogorensis NBRC 16594]